MTPNYLVLVLVLVTVLMATWLIPSPQDKVVFLDVGQGDAILLQGGTQQVLIDGGPGMTVLTRLAEEMPWFDRTIEVVMVTHPQQDHIEGLLHVLERYRVGLVILPRAAHTSQLQASWLQEISDRHIPYRFGWSGQQIMLGDLALRIVHPDTSAASAAAIRSDINNASVSTRVDFHGLSLLLTGDAERPAEDIIIAHQPAAALDVDILKAGHHGSKSSTSPELLTAAAPAGVVISVGGDNRFGHPDSTVVKRLSGVPIWRTDEVGSVRFRYTQGRWQLSCSRPINLPGGGKSCIKTDI